MSVATLCLGILAEKVTGVFNTLSSLAVGWAWWSLGLLLWALSRGSRQLHSFAFLGTYVGVSVHGVDFAVPFQFGWLHRFLQLCNGGIQVFLIPFLLTAADWSGCSAGAVWRRASAVPCFCLGKQLRECVWDFLFVVLFIFGWIQTAGAASSRLKGRRTEQRVVSGSRKGNCCGVLEPRDILE